MQVAATCGRMVAAFVITSHHGKRVHQTGGKGIVYLQMSRWRQNGREDMRRHILHSPMRLQLAWEEWVQIVTTEEHRSGLWSRKDFCCTQPPRTPPPPCLQKGHTVRACLAFVVVLFFLVQSILNAPKWAFTGTQRAAKDMA